MNDYLRQHGFYLLGGAAAQVLSWGCLAIGSSTGSDGLITLGGLLLLASAAVLVRHAWRALLLGGLLLAAVLTIGGFALYALASLMHPLVIAALLGAVAIGLLAFAGRWWEANGDAETDFMQQLGGELTNGWSALRARRRGATTDRAAAPRLTLTQPRATVRFERPPQQDRLCQACGRLIPAAEPRCQHPDCEQHGANP